MERAAMQWTQICLTLHPDLPGATILCGSGNNGGDGLAIARLLSEKMIPVHLILCKIGPFSADLKKNLDRLHERQYPQLQIDYFDKGDRLEMIKPTDVIIDGIFGSGLNRPVTGQWGELIQAINQKPNKVYSIDIPSGMHPDKPMEGAVIMADMTITFELPKLAFMWPENARNLGHLEIVSIGLNQAFLEEVETSNEYLTSSDIRTLIQRRSKFDHKGVFGHGLLIAGSKGKMGAALLAGKAALRSGIGLLTLHVPQRGLDIIQIGLPEAMVSVDENESLFSNMPAIDHFDAVGIGCGLSTDPICAAGMQQVLERLEAPIVIDADGLNLLAANQELLSMVPKGSILTPHLKEFERIFGSSNHHFERLEKAKENARKYQLHILVKGANSAIATPEGKLFFNSTGNPGMATAGSGDVLTGMITGLLTQQYHPLTAAKIGMYLHGKAGDLAASKLGCESVIAGDIIDSIPGAFQSILN
jgi:NAD(P)H-hydrate epimerase